MKKVCIFWFRRDLRLHDNAGLYHALKSEYPVLPLFIFDRNILDDLEDKKDARVSFIHQAIEDLHQKLEKLGSSLIIKYGFPKEIWKELLSEYDIQAVYTNRDYESYAIDRDKKIEKILNEENVELHDYKDHVIFEKKEVVKKDGDPYVVFSPYARVWRDKLESRQMNNISYYLHPYPTEKYFDAFFQTKPLPLIPLKDMGFVPTEVELPPMIVPQKRIKEYDKKRNFPGIKGTSRLGIHFRFGTISIRQKALKAQKLNKTYLNELTWRDFYAMILANFPHVETKSFREKYERIPWRNDEDEFEAWCEGKTGYPMVDAGMRELNQTGFMHNRVRMVTASFLTKHLLIDWRWGEAYFAKKLLDFELASNNGGWQWAAGSGTDAAPYFRIFNPESQLKKFDKDRTYVKKWIPELGTDEYPEPIVEHKFARERCLSTYKEALNS